MPERTFWRIVRTDPSMVRDFLSSEAQGLPPRDHDPDTLRLWSGISVYSTPLQARRTATTYPFLGRYLADLRIVDDAGIRWEKTRGRGHHTLWGDPQAILNCVVRVVPVRER